MFDIIIISLVSEERVREQVGRKSEGGHGCVLTSMRAPGPISLFVIGALSRCERNAYEPWESQQGSVAENFKATETIVRQRSRMYAAREAGEGAQALANARAHPFDYL